MHHSRFIASSLHRFTQRLEAEAYAGFTDFAALELKGADLHCREKHPPTDSAEDGIRK